MASKSDTGKFFKELSKEGTPYAKITVVGVGQVGMAAAYCMMLQGVASEIALVDVVADKLKGELMDLQHCQAFTRNVRIKASTGLPGPSDQSDKLNLIVLKLITASQQAPASVW